jgi:hypothetical protein
VNHAEFNDRASPADMRDIRAIRVMLGAHIDEQQRHNALVAARLGIVPPGDHAPLSVRWHRWLPALPTNRLVLAAFVTATALSVAGSVAALPVARSFWPAQQVPPHVHETARVER